MAKIQLLAFEILMIVYVTSAAPVEAESGGISTFFQKLKPTDDNLGTSYRDVDDYETYRQKKAEQGFTSLCWTESLIITEDKRTHIKNMSKAYSIILESAANSGEHNGGNQNTSCYKIEGDDDIRKERIFNFTTVKETDLYSIKEHKTLFCGAGPVLSEHFIVWPKLNRKKIEISISPMTSTEWRTCEENEVEHSDILGSSLLSGESNTLDNSKEQYIGSRRVLDESTLDFTESSYDPNTWTEYPRVGMGKNIDDSSFTKSLVDVKKSLSGFEETTVNNTSNKTNHPDWSTDVSREGTKDSRVGSISSTQLTKVTIGDNMSKEVGQVGPSQIDVMHIQENSDVEKSVDYIESKVNPQTKSKKITKQDPELNPRIPREYLLSNALLNRYSNCTSRNESICNEIMSKSSLIAEFQNTSKATLANLFFPNNTLLHIFRDAGNNSYILNAKVVLELKKSDLDRKIEDEDGAYLLMEEESKYQFIERSMFNEIL